MSILFLLSLFKPLHSGCSEFSCSCCIHSDLWWSVWVHMCSESTLYEGCSNWDTFCSERSISPIWCAWYSFAILFLADLPTSRTSVLPGEHCDFCCWCCVFHGYSKEVPVSSTWWILWHTKVHFEKAVAHNPKFEELHVNFCHDSVTESKDWTTLFV